MSPIVDWTEISLILCSLLEIFSVQKDADLNHRVFF